MDLSPDLQARLSGFEARARAAQQRRQKTYDSLIDDYSDVLTFFPDPIAFFSNVSADVFKIVSAARDRCFSLAPRERASLRAILRHWDIRITDIDAGFCPKVWSTRSFLSVLRRFADETTASWPETAAAIRSSYQPSRRQRQDLIGPRRGVKPSQAIAALDRFKTDHPAPVVRRPSSVVEQPRPQSGPGTLSPGQAPQDTTDAAPSSIDHGTPKLASLQSPQSVELPRAESLQVSPANSFSQPSPHQSPLADAEHNVDSIESAPVEPAWNDYKMTYSTFSCGDVQEHLHESAAFDEDCGVSPAIEHGLRPRRRCSDSSVRAAAGEPSSLSLVQDAPPSKRSISCDFEPSKRQKQGPMPSEDVARKQLGDKDAWLSTDTIFLILDRLLPRKDGLVLYNLGSFAANTPATFADRNSASRILAPFNYENQHWVLLDINLAKLSCCIYDSSRAAIGEHALQACVAERLKRITAHALTFSFPSCTQQDDAVSCGLFVVVSALKIALDAAFPDVNAPLWRRVFALLFTDYKDCPSAISMFAIDSCSDWDDNLSLVKASQLRHYKDEAFKICSDLEKLKQIAAKLLERAISCSKEALEDAAVFTGTRRLVQQAKDAPSSDKTLTEHLEQGLRRALVVEMKKQQHAQQARRVTDHVRAWSELINQEQEIAVGVRDKLILKWKQVRVRIEQFLAENPE